MQNLKAIYPKWRVKLTQWDGHVILYNQLGQLLIYHKLRGKCFEESRVER